MKRDASFFEGKQPVLLYIARKLGEALRLEELLAAAGVDFGVEADEYRGGVIFKSLRIGAFFYVLPDAAEAARRVLLANGLKPAEEEPQE